MPTNMPGAVDTFPSAVDLADDTLGTKPHSALHGDLGDALLATETLMLTHAAQHESSGSDPITNLGTLTGTVTLSDGTFDRVVLAADGTALTIKDDAGNPRIVTSDIGEGISIKDDTGQTRVNVSEAADNSSAGLGVYDAAGDPVLFATEDTGFLVGDPVGVALAQLTGTTTAGGELNIFDGAGAGFHILSGVGTGSAGFFAATPYGQDANIPDPTGGLVTDAEARTAIASILDALEARGWMAA